MKLLLCYAGVLIGGALLVGGCVPEDQAGNRYLVQHGHYDNNGGYYTHVSGHTDNHGNWQPDNHDNGQLYDHGNGQPDNHGYGQPDNHGDGQHDNHGAGSRDSGDRAIASYVMQHALPVNITNIAHLPSLTVPGMASPTLARYQVSTESTGSPTVKIVHIVDYNPATGALALER